MSQIWPGNVKGVYILNAIGGLKSTWNDIYNPFDVWEYADSSFIFRRWHLLRLFHWKK